MQSVFSDCNCIRKVHALLPMRIIMKFSPSVHPEAENDTEEYANRTLSVDPSVFYRFICRRQSVSRYMGNHRINVNPSFYERRKRRHAPCGKNDGGRTYAPYGRPVWEVGKYPQGDTWRNLPTAGKAGEGTEAPGFGKVSGNLSHSPLKSRDLKPCSSVRKLVVPWTWSSWDWAAGEWAYPGCWRIWQDGILKPTGKTSNAGGNFRVPVTVRPCEWLPVVYQPERMTVENIGTPPADILSLSPSGPGMETVIWNHWY